MGSLLAETGLIEPGLVHLRRAIEIDPTNEMARAEIPYAYLYNAMYDEAIAANRELTRSRGRSSTHAFAPACSD